MDRNRNKSSWWLFTLACKSSPTLSMANGATCSVEGWTFRTPFPSPLQLGRAADSLETKNTNKTFRDRDSQRTQDRGYIGSAKMIGSEVEALTNLLMAHGDKVLSGGQRLALTAALVQKVSAAFSLLVASGSGDLRDFQVVPASSNTRLNALHFLHDFLQRVDSLLVSHGSSTLRGDVELTKFRNLKWVLWRQYSPH